jgi:hypothetical protein
MTLRVHTDAYDAFANEWLMREYTARSPTRIPFGGESPISRSDSSVPVAWSPSREIVQLRTEEDASECLGVTDFPELCATEGEAQLCAITIFPEHCLGLQYGLRSKGCTGGNSTSLHS